MDAPSYATQVKTRRRAAGLTQRQLAEVAAVKQPLIAAIESGRRSASPAVRAALDQVLQVRPSAILRLMSPEIADAAAKVGAGNLRVFGSIARGTDEPGSDVDLLVTLPAGSDIVTLLDLEAEFAGILTVDVDLIPDSGNSDVLASAVQEAVPL